ncbi:MAG: flagellin, partial [Planctomycetota bacterium]
MPGIRGSTGFPSHFFERTSLRIGRGFERLASGKRINRGADDAAGLAIAERLGALEVSAAQGKRNLTDGISLVRVADGGLNESAGILVRMRELAVQANNGTLSDPDRAMIQQEFDQLSSELTRISESTEFNGKQLLNGDLSGPGAVSLEEGTSMENLVVSIDGQSAVDLGVDGLRVSDPATIHAVAGAIDRVSGARSSLGAIENQLMREADILDEVRETTAAARSRISDADVAIENAALTRGLLIKRAQVSLHVQAGELQT